MLTGVAGVRTRRDPDTTCGVGVVVSAEVLANQPDNTTIVEGLPTLAVEILSPNDVIEDVNEKIDALLEAGAPMVRLIDPHRRTVAVRVDADTELYGSRQGLPGEPVLPGLRVPVVRLFD